MKKVTKTLVVGVIVVSVISCAPQRTSQSQNGSRGNRSEPPTFTQLLAQMDANKDGKLSKSEVKGPLASDFSKVDSNNDGFITESELKDAPRTQGRGPR